MKKVGDFLRDLRVSRNITQASLAKRIGVTQNFLSQIEKGLREPNRRLLASIVDYVLAEDCSGSYIVTELLGSILENFIPGTACSVGSDGTLTAHLSTNGNVSVHIKKNVKEHTSQTQEILKVLEDTRIRDALHQFIGDENILKVLMNKSCLKAIKAIVSSLGDKSKEQLDFIATIVSNMPK